MSALAAAEELLEAEEAAKAALIRDLNSLIFQSSVQQMEALETLQTRMEELSVKAGGIVRGDGHSHPHPPVAAAPPGVSGSAEPARAGGAGGAHPDAVTLARAEMAAVVRLLSPTSLFISSPRASIQALVQAAEITEARARHVSLHKPPRPPPAQPARQQGESGGFSGFAE